MDYRYKNMFKNGKFLGTTDCILTAVAPIMDIEISYYNKEGTEEVKQGTRLDLKYQNGFYILGRYSPLKEYAISEEILNKYFVVMDLSFSLEEKKGLQIFKGPFKVYDTNDCGLQRKKEYIKYIDSFLKQMFLYDNAIVKCFMGKTLKVVKELQTTLKTATAIEMENCIKSVNEYLSTTLKTMENLSEKTDLSDSKVVKQLMEKTKAQEFMEDMKYRNQVAMEFYKTT